MTNQEWLYRGFELQREIIELQQALRNAKNEAVYISPSFSKAKTNQKAGNRPENRAVNSIQYQEMLAQKIAKKQQILAEIAEAIDGVKNKTYRTMLVRRYINCKPVEVIAWEQHYSERWVQTLLRRAESKIKQK